ncbi:PTS sugar transporter subunit IIA [Clostridium omnivorum]|uniref:PTS mannose transporter subunit IIAB n=1 Tax=Clostridium omnivorum TaxID=1604902 RepID=A0ABQ5N3F0_9CLOT|nr:PTS sugar transporter subunit IIA [Clostridium sp. E14]GLC29575.1 PTS mannose transporter subunit IIAB [Clostridium sp. E14]
MDLDLCEVLDDRLVKFDFPGNTKEEVIKSIAAIMYEAGKVADINEYIEGVIQREKECETGIGRGVAIPHCKNGAVKQASFALVQLKNNIEWGSLDGAPVNYVIMLAAPNTEDNVHLRMLSQLAKNLMDDDFLYTLTHAKSIEQIKNLFKGRC